MRPMRISLERVAVLIALVGFNLAVVIRAYQRGRQAGAVVGSLFGFGLVLLVFNMVLVQIGWSAIEVKRTRTGDRWLLLVLSVLPVALSLAILTLPVLAGLFRRPRNF